MPDHFATMNKIYQMNSGLIKKNIINFYNLALTNESRELKFSNLPDSEGNTYIEHSPSFIDYKDSITVNGVSIDDCVKKGFKPPTMMKIDVEGAEYDVLQGAKNTLCKYKPKILLATHDFHVPGIKDKCISFLKELSYDLRSTDAEKTMIGLEDFYAEFNN